MQAAVSKLPTNKAVQGCRDAPRAVPIHRWDLDSLSGAARFGSFVEGADSFDAAAFSMSR